MTLFVRLMPEFMRSIANRLRQYVGERRRAPRYQLHMEAGLALSVTLPGPKQARDREGQKIRIAGYTRDISESGLALIVPSVRIGGHYIAGGENRTLQIVLKLPTGLVEIHGTPVRYSRLEEEENAEDTGYLIGVRIDSMSDQDRARYNAYLKTLAKKAGE